METIKEVLFNYTEYLQTPCYSGEEDKLANKLIRDFRCKPVADVPEILPLVMDNVDSPYLFIAHMDRIKVKYKPPVFMKQYDGCDIIEGQLDNTITIGCFKALKDEGLNFNILFTRREEVCGAHFDVINLCKKLDRKYKIVDCDIDVYKEDDEWKDSISIRYKDNIAEFDCELVSELREVAYEYGFPVDSKTDWLVGTAGFIVDESRKDGKEIPAAYLGLPILDYHTNHEKVSVNSLKKYYNMLKVLCGGSIVE